MEIHIGDRIADITLVGKLYLIPFLTHQGNVCDTVSYMYFHY